MNAVALDLLSFVGGRQFATILADPPWRFSNKTGKVAPEHKRLARYSTLSFAEIEALPIPQLTTATAHLYLWCPNALLPEGLSVMKAWGFTYKSNVVWHKIRKDGGSDGRGVGFYFRNVTELVLFGVKGKKMSGPTNGEVMNSQPFGSASLTNILILRAGRRNPISYFIVRFVPVSSYFAAR